MMIVECRDALDAVFARTGCFANSGTPLKGDASAIIEMAEAYRKDGTTFYNKGDLVNALAAFFYGAGWLHFGISSGLLTCRGNNPFCPFSGPSEKLPLPQEEKLREKTRRYEILLNTARSSVECAAERGTISNEFAGKILFIAHIYAELGTRHRQHGTYEDALASFSYGHGWLDAAVTCGYFRILANREIFTV
jgi:hypothetical protein